MYNRIFSELPDSQTRKPKTSKPNTVEYPSQDQAQRLQCLV